MRAIIKCSWKMMLIIPMLATLISCGHSYRSSSYRPDNKKRMRHLEATRTKYPVPGQSRVKTGNLNDGF